MIAILDITLVVFAIIGAYSVCAHGVVATILAAERAYDRWLEYRASKARERRMLKRLANIEKCMLNVDPDIYEVFKRDPEEAVAIVTAWQKETQ